MVRENLPLPEAWGGERPLHAFYSLFSSHLLAYLVHIFTWCINLTPSDQSLHLYLTCSCPRAVSRLAHVLTQKRGTRRTHACVRRSCFYAPFTLYSLRTHSHPPHIIMQLCILLTSSHNPHFPHAHVISSCALTPTHWSSRLSYAPMSYVLMSPSRTRSCLLTSQKS